MSYLTQRAHGLSCSCDPACAHRPGPARPCGVAHEMCTRPQNGADPPLHALPVSSVCPLQPRSASELCIMPFPTARVPGSRIAAESADPAPCAAPCRCMRMCLVSAGVLSENGPLHLCIRRHAYGARSLQALGDGPAASRRPREGAEACQSRMHVDGKRAGGVCACLPNSPREAAGGIRGLRGSRLRPDRRLQHEGGDCSRMSCS